MPDNRDRVRDMIYIWIFFVLIIYITNFIHSGMGGLRAGARTQKQNCLFIGQKRPTEIFTAKCEKTDKIFPRIWRRSLQGGSIWSQCDAL